MKPWVSGVFGRCSVMKTQQVAALVLGVGPLLLADSDADIAKREQTMPAWRMKASARKMMRMPTTSR